MTLPINRPPLQQVCRGGLPHYPPGESVEDRIARCIEHELYYGGNHKAAAAAIMRDIRHGYIVIPHDAEAVE
jgi:hypothetical protein